jgi:flavin-dependent dehydrogenase
MIYDALIVGSGPAGATTALLLAEAGWSVAIVEKQEFPRRKVCGEFISATSLPLLQKLGLADLYLQQGGAPVRRVGIFAADAMITSAMPAAQHELTQWGRAFGREHLDTELLSRAVKAGATLWQPFAVKTLQRQNSVSAVTVVADEQCQIISARTVIMAHGSWERGVESAMEPAHQPGDLLAFKAHFKNSSLAPDLMPLLAFPGGYGGMAHSDSGRVTLSCCVQRKTLQAIRKKYSGIAAGEAVLQHIMAYCVGVRQALQTAKREGKWLSAGPIRPGIRQRYADGVFYVGNIAGEAHPIVAEGISMAMQSGWLLAENLLAHRDDMAMAGRLYAKQWRAHFAPRIQAAALFSIIAMRPWLVKSILPVLKTFPKLLTFGARLSGKVKQVVPALALVDKTI